MTLVALHGAYGAPTDWDGVWALLPQNRRADARALWLPGHEETAQRARPCGPKSERSEQQETLWEQALHALEGELEDLSPIDLVGYSMGARLALALALRPGVTRRLRSLVLVAGTAGIDGDDAGELRATRAALDDARATALIAQPDDYLRSFWQLPLFEQLRAHADYDALLAARIARVGRRPTTLAGWTAGLSVGRQPPLWRELAPLRDVAVGLVVGTLDSAYVAHARRFAALLPSARISWAEGCGHALLVEAPQVVARTLVEVCP